MNEKTLSRFNSTAIRSKGELLEALQEYANRLRRGESTSVPGGEKRCAALLNLLEMFIEKVEATVIPALDQPFFAYQVFIGDTEISLEMGEYTKVVYDNEGEIVETESLVTNDIVYVEAEYMPIEEFARQQQVQPATVRQWIRRGKLRNVAKRGSNWYVASTAVVNERGYESGAYRYIGEEGDLCGVFPLPKGTYSIDIFQDCSSIDKYNAYLRDRTDKTIEKLQLDRSTREKLEHALIAHPDVRFQNTLIDTITDKVSKAPLSEEELPAASKERLRIMQAPVSSEAKALLLLIEESGTQALLMQAYKLLEIEE